jgi:hypothetical protein
MLGLRGAEPFCQIALCEAAVLLAQEGEFDLSPAAITSQVSLHSPPARPAPCSANGLWHRRRYTATRRRAAM